MTSCGFRKAAFFFYRITKEGNSDRTLVMFAERAEGTNIRVLLWDMGCSHEPWPLIITEFPGSSLRNICPEASEWESLWHKLQYKRWSSERCKERRDEVKVRGREILTEGWIRQVVQGDIYKSQRKGWLILQNMKSWKLDENFSSIPEKVT